MKRLFSIILAIGFFAFGAAGTYNFGEFPGLAAFADETDKPAVPAEPAVPAAPDEPTEPDVTTEPSEPVSNEITAENITLEYEETPYNGAVCKPLVTVELGSTVLLAGTDYSIRYPEDCTNIGEKTITIRGKGDYTGEVQASYTILPLDCTDNPEVEIEVEDCHYNGLPQYPNVTVKFGSYVIPKENYTLTLSDNTEVSADKKAQCTVKFRGNCTGERTGEFSILKKSSYSLEIDITAKTGQAVSIDLTPIKPAGAIFGNPVFLNLDFSPGGQPKIAFNMLRFTLDPTLDRNTAIVIPMTNIANCEDSWLEFYIEIVDREIPNLVLKPLVKEYNGKPFNASELNDNGSYAYINGEVLEGKWTFVMSSSREQIMPCEKTPTPVMFTPDDPKYSCAYGVVDITIQRKDVRTFAADCKTTLNLGEKLSLTTKGIPDEFDGNVTITAAENDEFSIVSETDTEGGKDYVLEFPLKNAYHKLKVTLGGSAFYAPQTIELRIKVGNPPDEPPADVPTTESELAALIEKAEAGAVIKANRMTSVSADSLTAAAAKRLTIEVKANDNISYILEPAKMKSISALNLTVNTAVIPQVLLDKLGDEELYSFTSFAKCSGGVSIKLSAESELPISCLYLYNTTGELEHIASILRKGESVQFELPGSGKFAITASRVSHIYRDLNNDCRINVRDVTTALKLILEIDDEPSAEQLETLDFDEDKRLTVRDVTTILKYALNL